MFSGASLSGATADCPLAGPTERYHHDTAGITGASRVCMSALYDQISCDAGCFADSDAT